MTAGRESLGRTALVVVLVSVAVFAPTMVAARPANQVPVYAAGSNADLTQPNGSTWSQTSTVTVPLTSAPSGLPNASDVSTSKVNVQAAHTDQRIYVRLSWPDGTDDANITGPRTFTDAAAVEVPVNVSSTPAIAMGTTSNPVNVWYWNAGIGTEEILAGGPGTTTQFPNASVTTRTRYADGRWSVVFSRPLSTGEANRTTFGLDRNVDVAFAVWNGSNMERSGRKAVSEWYHLPLGPQPSGPPYQTILWAIAGIAIAVVVVVTVTAVRRT